jgi:hypothetical protein
MAGKFIESKEANWNPATSISDEDAWKYVQCMEEIKRRYLAISCIMRRRHTTPYRATNIEFICLQIRKILELIALASLAANKEEYSKQHANFFKHWQAKRILESIKKINPFFYPTPQKDTGILTKGVRTVELITEGYLTKTEFAEVYDLCSRALHADNPYNAIINYKCFEKQIPVWLERIRTLLNHHQVHLVSKDGKKRALWVIMRGEDEKVHGTIFEKISDTIPEALEKAEKNR